MAIYKDTNKTKDGRCWYFKVYKKNFEGVNKAYKSKRYLTKREAIEEEALFLLKRDNPNKKEFLLVAKAYFEEMYRTRKESTVHSYENAYKRNIEPYFRKFFISDIQMPIINNWKQNMAEKSFKITYLNKLHGILKRIFDFAIKNYGLQTNIVAISGRFQEKNDTIISDEERLRYITFKEFQKFVSVIEDIVWKTFFMFLYYTGCRKGEVLALTWKDIDFKSNYIKINKTLYSKIKGKTSITSTKNNKNRTIKMNKTLSEQLLEYKKEMMKFKDFNENWFVFGCARFLPLTSIDRYKHKYFQLSEVNEITIHEFRHSHVSLLINEYIKSGQTDTTKFFLMMSSRMGHSIQVMQETYMHLFPSIQNEIVDILDNL